MRCFIAVNFSESFIKQIDHIFLPIKIKYPDLRWTRSNNFHLTLKFYGEIDHTLESRLKIALDDFKTYSLTIVTSDFISCFPKRSNPRVIWLGLDESTRIQLQKIFDHIEVLSGKCGIGRERRSFSPHLTIARVPKNQNLDDSFWKNVSFLKAPSLCEKIRSIDLMESKLNQRGAEYSIRKIFELN